ncbi:hypothetical protein FOA43_004416 [Brettanomyces nanus]|uniref:SART-1 family protein n=1 Tax=Eeniella nana TaxID=13502 RepID=A0A875SBZ1_EENNA|nr:uncharacterized protein FOA43_004416 [Brettanomyces nanus]QPG77019.1 hypothetical protein FOA43_004416 [Brettanomyces nanus]
MRISLSVEETNKLRAQVGLCPIPVEGEKLEIQYESQKPLAVNMRKDEDGCYSISVEETNKLREQIGLGLISIGGYLTENVGGKESESGKKAGRLRANLLKAKNELKKEKYLSRGGILDRIGDDKDEHDWLTRLGEREKGKGKKKLRFKGKSKKEETADELSFAHNDEKGEVILTLKDKLINGESADEDELENIEMVEKERIREAMKNRTQGRMIDLEDEEDGSSNMGGKKVNQESNSKRKLIVLKDDSDDNEDSSGIIKRSDFKRIKRVREDGNKFKRTDRFTVDKEAFKKIRIVNEDMEKEDNLELNSFMSATRKRRLEKRLESRRKEISAEESNVELIKNSLVIDEDADFLDRLDSINKGGEVELKDRTQSRNSTSEDSKGFSSAVLERVSTILDDSSSNSQSMGVSSVLKLLKNEEQASGKPKDPSNGISLVYTDDKGKVLSTKEAYKYLSHKFHGYRKH